MSAIETDKRNKKSIPGGGPSPSAGGNDGGNDNGDSDDKKKDQPEPSTMPPIDRSQAQKDLRSSGATSESSDPPSYADKSAQTDQSIAEGKTADSSLDKSADSTVDAKVESKTEPASDPAITTGGGPDKPHS